MLNRFDICHHVVILFCFFLIILKRKFQTYLWASRFANVVYHHQLKTDIGLLELRNVVTLGQARSKTGDISMVQEISSLEGRGTSSNIQTIITCMMVSFITQETFEYTCLQF